MQKSQVIYKDPIYIMGLVGIFLSGFVYCYPLMSSFPVKENLLLFFFNYSLAVAYFLILFVNRKKIDSQRKLDYRFLLLILFLISAYSLNRDMSVFERSVNWLTMGLIISCLNYILYSFFNQLPGWARQIPVFISGFSFVLFSYMAIYLLPLYGIGILGLLAFGISVHVFVPILFAVNTIYLIKRASPVQKNIWISFFTGVTIPLFVVLIFTMKWNNLKRDIDQVYSNHKNRNELPSWIYMAQKIPASSLTEKMLKSGIAYSIPERAWDNLLWRMPDMNFGEAKKHDPLVMSAALFNGSLDIDESDRIQMLKSIFRSRHQAEERLWSGDDLFTEKVNSLVKVWQDCNIAYTEKTIIVSNKAVKRFQPGQQEAIYTFYLPEGGVVTSLSLWVNDKEEKAILTTKEKADSAYKTVVGVERRDPSVVHWQEGNRVTLRVFPVLSGESRKFKIGITAPLERAKGKLVYENIYFDGPDNSKAKESIQVDFDQPAKGFQIPVTFVSKSSQSYSRQANYEPFWNLIFPDKGLKNCSFSFDGSIYSLKSYHKKLGSVIIDDIYLDVNKSWTKTEFDKIIEKTGNKNIYVYDKDVIKVTSENKNQLFEKLNKNEFSLFPLYKLKNPPVSLLITKGSTNSCNIDDMEHTPFIEQTKKFLSGNQKVKLFNIGEDLSPYLKSLKEFRIFHYDYGDPEILSHILSENLFVEDIENDDRVIIHKTDMVIEKSSGTFSSAGPDHIMRLFVYNHIMQKIGTGLIMNRPIEDELVEEARKAYVVSPLSSLVVLETEQDYKRFDIMDSGSTLKNASLNSKGAVPEPHEWILIITGVLLIVYIKFQPKLKWVKS